MRSSFLARLGAALTGVVLAFAGLTITTAPAQATGKPCAAYLYFGTQRDLCNEFPGERDRDCKDVRFKVKLKNPDYDPWRLSRGGNKWTGCEEYRDCPVPTATPTTRPTTRPPTTAPTTPPTTPPTTEPTIVPPPVELKPVALAVKLTLPDCGGPQPTTAPTTAPTAAPTTSPTDPAPTATADPQEPTLPLTGPPIVAVAGGALALVLVGGVLLGAFRRRRRTFTA